MIRLGTVDRLAAATGEENQDAEGGVCLYVSFGEDELGEGGGRAFIMKSHLLVLLLLRALPRPPPLSFLPAIHQLHSPALVFDFLSFSFAFPLACDMECGEFSSIDE